jgi:hypothetical protein
VLEADTAPEAVVVLTDAAGDISTAALVLVQPPEAQQVRRCQLQHHAADVHTLPVRRPDEPGPAEHRRSDGRGAQRRQPLHALVGGPGADAERL